MPPSPRSLLWPTMEMPRKLYFSVEGVRVMRGSPSHMTPAPRPWLPHTHVECDCDDVERHGGIRDAAEGGGLWWEKGKELG